MLKNKKKLRRLERNTPGYAVKTAQSLVLAGALVGALTLGGAGVAAAVETFTPAGGTYTEAMTLGQRYDITGNQTFGATLTINGSATGNHFGMVDEKAVLTVNINGGATLTAGGGISVGTLNIKGGETTVSGKMDPYNTAKPVWRAGSMLSGLGAVNITGNATVDLGNYGQVVTGTGGAINITGSTIKMTSTAKAEAGILRASYYEGRPESTIILDKSTVAVDASKYGVIASNNTILKNGSKITVTSGGKLHFTQALGDDKTTTTETGWTDTTNDVVFSSGSITLLEGSRIETDKGNFKAGTITIDGVNAGTRSGIYDADGQADTGVHVFGDSAAHTGPTVNIANGGGIEGKDITINGGSFTIGGKGTFPADPAIAEWRKGSILFGMESLKVTGGNITLGDYAVMGVGTNSGSDAGLQIEGGTVTLAGTSADKTAILRAAHAAGNPSNNAATFEIGKSGATAKVVATGYGRLMGADVKVLKGGLLDVQKGGHVLITRDRDASDDLQGAFDDKYALAVDSTKLTINGGSVNVDGDMLIASTPQDGITPGVNGIVDMGNGGVLRVTGNLNGTTGQITGGGDANTKVTVLGTYTTRGSADGNAGSKIDYASLGTLTVGALNLVSRVADGTSKLSVSNGAVEFLGLDGKASVFNGEAINVTGGKLNFGSSSEATKGGSYGGTVTVSSSGTMQVAGGNWAVKNLDVQAGVAKINGGMLTITNDLKSAAVGNGATGTTGINVYAGGALSAARTMVVANTASGTPTLKTIDVAAGGTLLLTGTGSMTLAEVKTLRTQVMTGKGALDLGSVAITGVTADDTLETVKDSASIGGIVKGGALTSGTAVVGGISTDATVTGGADLALTGKGTNGVLATGKVTVGDATNSSTVTLGSAAQATTGIVGGAITTAGDKANTIQTVNGAFTVGGGIDLSTGSGADKLNVINSSLSTTSITAGTGDVINVGSATSSGTLTADSVKLGGGSLFIDPAWGQASSRVAIAQFTDGATAPDVSALGGKVGVGRNSMLSVGTKDTALLDGVVGKLGGLEQDGYTAALGLYHSVTLNSGTGGIMVDGTKTNSTFGTISNDSATFAEDSLLVVNASAGLGTNGALHAAGSGTLNLDKDATLLVVNGQAGQTVKITSGFGSLTTPGSGIGGWTGDNLFTDTALVYGEGSFASGSGNYTVDLKSRAATTVFPKLSASMGGLVDNVMRVRDLDSPNAGIRFVSRATSDAFIGRNDAEKAAATIEGAAQMGAVAGVQISTIGAASVASGAVTTRTSFAQPLMDMTKAVAVHQDNDGTLSLDTGLNAGNGMKNGLGVWIMPLYQSNNTWGQKAENFKSGMSSDLGGIALGADYTINDMFRFGAAFNVGGGYAQSSGDFNETENRFNFWGVNLYGGWTMNNFGLSADVGYTSSFNAVEQDTPAAMAMGNLKADVTTSAWTAGLKGEYKFETSVVDIIPHVGVRYMGLTTDSYDVKSGGTVFGVEQDFQSIWTFPIGVAFSKTITSDSGWMFKPMVDLTVIPAAGDLEAKSKASIPGVGGQAEMKMQVVDYVTFDGGLGFEVGKDNLSFGLNYNIQASEHRTGHGVFGTLRYEF